MPTLSPASTDAQIAQLRNRIGWICQALRLAAAAYPTWVLWLLASVWADAPRVASVYGRVFDVDLSGLATWQQATGFSLEMVAWTLLVGACCTAWRLFSAYLEGDIFSAGSARLMRRVALLGIAAQLLSMGVRPLLSVILTAHLPARSLHIPLQPYDLVTLLLLSCILALAHIQKTGAEIASEHAQIV